MPLIYSFVARGNVVLADFTSYTGNFSTVALQVSPQAGPDPPDRGPPPAGACVKTAATSVASGTHTEHHYMSWAP